VSLRLDLHILAATVGAVVRRNGISASETETMPEFMGQDSVAQPSGAQGQDPAKVTR
jgi:hypothetical protein